MINRILYIFSAIIFTAVVLTSCDDMDSVLPEVNNIETETSGALYILCDGNYSLNNSTLALYDFKASNLSTDFFNRVNNRKLGDTGNDMKIYGSKIYVIVNVSGQLEVLDAVTGKSIKRIPFFDGEKSRQPRYMTFWEDKIYVCSFDGSVARLDTSNLEIEAITKAGRNPDGITVSNNKLYVSNSGGLDHSSDVGYDNTVSVIDINSFKELKKITVGKNPYKILSDDFGFVYVACRGDYADEKPAWLCINASTDRVVANYDVQVMNFDIWEDKAYLYEHDNKTGLSSIKIFNLVTRELSDFSADVTGIVTPYGISVNRSNGDIYITDAGNYVSSGSVYCFRNNGSLKYRISQVGVSPNSVVFVKDFKSQSNGGIGEEDKTEYIEHVLDYSPAPGQFVGTYPLYVAGDDDNTMRLKAEGELKGRVGGLVTLGRFGGSITFSFKNTVLNKAGSNDFKIFGNAFNNSAEPGIVEVSVDENKNGKADDKWYELAGSEYYSSKTTKGFSIKYFRPAILKDSVDYSDNKGGKGKVNAFYPAWKGDNISFTGNLLYPSATKNETTGFWVLNSLPWGYADNKPNDSPLCEFDLDAAVDSEGKKVVLSEIDFVRVYTGVNQNAGWVGEISAEIAGAANLSR